MKLLFKKNNKLHFPILLSIRSMHNPLEGAPIGGGSRPIPLELQEDPWFMRNYERYQTIAEQLRINDPSVTPLDRDFYNRLTTALKSFVEEKEVQAALDAKSKSDEFEMVYSPTMTDASAIPNSNSFGDVTTTISNTIVQQGFSPQEPTMQTSQALQPLIMNEYWQYIQLAQIGRFFFYSGVAFVAIGAGYYIVRRWWKEL